MSRSVIAHQVLNYIFFKFLAITSAGIQTEFFEIIKMLEYEEKKIKKDRFPFRMSLKQTDDILSLIGKEAARPFLIGFAAETDALAEEALKKLKKKLNLSQKEF